MVARHLRGRVSHELPEPSAYGVPTAQGQVIDAIELPARYPWRFYGLAWLAIIVGVIAFLDVMPALLRPQGLTGFMVALAYALVPVTIIAVFVWFVDRWEPEPAWLYASSFLWGCGVSALLASILNSALAVRISQASETIPIELASSAYVAPFVEEIIKGSGVVLLYIFFRRYFDGEVDGIVYGALIGAGFSFTENIVYFVRNYDEIELIFRYRFLDGPLNHEAWTAVFGFIIGLSVYSRRKAAAWIAIAPAWLFAALGHWVNNVSLTWPGMTYQRYVLLNNVPIAIVLTVLIIYSRDAQQKAVARGLSDYERAGWLAPSEIRMIMNLRLRKRARSWAETRAREAGAQGGSGANAMREFQRALLQLGLARTKALRTGTVNDPGNRELEADLLHTITDIRRVFTGLRS
ncbi:MAG: PrsW family intramembrane metalloprotease [Actinomycetaceae bacterium]|nr:PrsW family intramembrane metalloprotease [Arcanobacterium sp.]MDD7505397.1 PrsW family intramembrane metalloprotease [Actinomycetaceae bacterium]MDY6142921.1 PrsW family intramembrane metalloprotease [Arcanobacterium sp.]